MALPESKALYAIEHESEPQVEVAEGRYIDANRRNSCRLEGCLKWCMADVMLVYRITEQNLP